MLLDKEKRISHLRDTELRNTMLRLLELWERAWRNHVTEVSNFLDPYHVKVASDILRGLPEMSFSVSGGYEGAERTRIAIFQSYYDESMVDIKLAFLQIKGNFKFQEVTHRDYLGSLLALGIKREKIGDILVHDDGCQVIVDEDIADYVIANCQKVHKVSVEISKITLDQLIMPYQEKKEIKATVASPRLDAVLGVGFGSSRTKILPDIRGEKVRVNWRNVTDPSYHVQAGDVISCKGQGRFIIESLTGESRKGRLFVTIHRFI